MNTMKKTCARAVAAAVTSIAVTFAIAMPAANAAPAGMTQAPEKPNGSGVSVSYRVHGVSQVGRTTSVALVFEGVTNANGASVTLSTEPGLSVQGDRTLILPTGKRSEAKVILLSEREGLFYFHVFTSQGTRRSVLSVPVQTGTAPPVMKSNGTLVRDAQGQLIMSMPAK